MIVNRPVGSDKLTLQFGSANELNGLFYGQFWGGELPVQEWPVQSVPMKVAWNKGMEAIAGFATNWRLDCRDLPGAAISLRTPAGIEPHSLFTDPVLKQLAHANRWNLVACPPDEAFWNLASSVEPMTASQVLKALAHSGAAGSLSGNTLVVSCRSPLTANQARLNRKAMQAYLTRVEREGGYSIANSAELATTQDMPLHRHSLARLILRASAPRAFEGEALAGFDPVPRIIASLTLREFAAASAPDGVAVSLINPKARQLLSNWLPRQEVIAEGWQRVGRLITDWTELDLTGNWVLTVSTVVTPTLVMQEGPRMGVHAPAKQVALENINGGTDWQSRPIRRGFHRLFGLAITRSGEDGRGNIKFQIGDIPEDLPVGPVTTYDKLPSDFLAELAREEAALRKSRGR
jgi:hypothetical protein